MATYESKRYATIPIAATQVANGSVTDAEFQYINTLASNAQTQITARAPLAGATFTGGVRINDSQNLNIGSATDLVISHDTNNSKINNTTGELRIGADTIKLMNQAEDETHLSATADGAVSLMHNNVTKIATSATGATVTGTLAATAVTGDGSGLTSLPTVGGSTGVDFNDTVKARWGTGNDLEIYHDGNDSYIHDGGTGDLIIRGATNLRLTNTGGDNYLQGVNGGEVSLYHNGSKKAETASGGLTVTGTLTATAVDGAPTDEDAIGALVFAYYSPSNSVVNIARGSTTAGSGLYVRTDSSWVIGNLNSSADPGENKPFSATGGTSTTLSGTWLCLNPCRRYNQGGHTNWSMGHFVRVS